MPILSSSIVALQNTMEFRLDNFKPICDNNQHWVLRRIGWCLKTVCLVVANEIGNLTIRRKTLNRSIR